jgi:hypothetical protein
MEIQEMTNEQIKAKELAELLNVFSGGKDVQYLNCDGMWITFPDTENIVTVFLNHGTIRIKPEPKRVALTKEDLIERIKKKELQIQFVEDPWVIHQYHGKSFNNPLNPQAMQDNLIFHTENHKNLSIKAVIPSTILMNKGRNFSPSFASDVFSFATDSSATFAKAVSASRALLISNAKNPIIGTVTNMVIFLPAFTIPVANFCIAAELFFNLASSAFKSAPSWENAFRIPIACTLSRFSAVRIGFVDCVTCLSAEFNRHVEVVVFLIPL